MTLSTHKHVTEIVEKTELCKDLIFLMRQTGSHPYTLFVSCVLIVAVLWSPTKLLTKLGDNPSCYLDRPAATAKKKLYR